jgi:membrane fusion protein, multidrug efflux system
MDPNTPAPRENLASRSAADSPTTVKKRRHRWVWVVVLAAFALLFYWAWHHEQKSQAATQGSGRGRFVGVVPVTIATAKTGNIGVYLDAIGTVTPVYFDSITAEVTGVITGVHYREGQTVHKGDPLIDIDSRPYEAQLVQAQGALERDQNMLDEAKMDLSRYQVAWSKNAIPRQTLEDQEKLVLQDQGTVKNDQGTVQFDQVQVGFCHITSPIDGRVGLRLVDPGNLVTANSTTTLVTIAQIQPITIVFTLAEDSLPQVMQQLRAGKTLKVDADDRSNANHLASGKLESVDNLIDTQTGTVKLRAEFDNRDGALFPNQFVNTRLLVRNLDNQILVPSSAIQHNGSQDFVYLIVDAKSNQPVADVDKQCAAHGGCKAVQHSVKSGISDSGNTAVTGLAAGNVVADSSFEKLQSGSEISISKIKLPSTSESSASTAP